MARGGTPEPGQRLRRANPIPWSRAAARTASCPARTQAEQARRPVPRAGQEQRDVALAAGHPAARRLHRRRPEGVKPPGIPCRQRPGEDPAAYKPHSIEPQAFDPPDCRGVQPLRGEHRPLAAERRRAGHRRQPGRMAPRVRPAGTELPGRRDRVGQALHVGRPGQCAVVPR